MAAGGEFRLTGMAGGSTMAAMKRRSFLKSLVALAAAPVALARLKAAPRTNLDEWDEQDEYDNMVTDDPQQGEVRIIFTNWGDVALRHPTDIVYH